MENFIFCAVPYIHACYEERNRGNLMLRNSDVYLITLNFIIWRASTRNSNQTFWDGGLGYRHTFCRQFGPPSSVLLFIVLSILMGFANGNINNNNNKNCCHGNKNVTGQLKLLSHILTTL